jgi:hypothetical protein
MNLRGGGMNERVKRGEINKSLKKGIDDNIAFMNHKERYFTVQE